MRKNSNTANGLAIVTESRNTFRNPDGSANIAAYARIAHHNRDAAIAAAVRKATRSLRRVALAAWRALGGAGRIRLNAPLRG